MLLHTSKHLSWGCDASPLQGCSNDLRPWPRASGWCFRDQPKRGPWIQARCHGEARGASVPPSASSLSQPSPEGPCWSWATGLWESESDRMLPAAAAAAEEARRSVSVATSEGGRALMGNWGGGEHCWNNTRPLTLSTHTHTLPVFFDPWPLKNGDCRQTCCRVKNNTTVNPQTHTWENTSLTP